MSQIFEIIKMGQTPASHIVSFVFVDCSITTESGVCERTGDDTVRDDVSAVAVWVSVNALDERSELGVNVVYGTLESING